MYFSIFWSKSLKSLVLILMKSFCAKNFHLWLDILPFCCSLSVNLAASTALTHFIEPYDAERVSARWHFVSAVSSEFASRPAMAYSLVLFPHSENFSCSGWIETMRGRNLLAFGCTSCRKTAPLEEYPNMARYDRIHTLCDSAHEYVFAVLIFFRPKRQREWQHMNS